MKTQSYTHLVNLPTFDEFGESYPQYGNYARDKAQFLYDHIVNAESFIFMMVATSLGLPAVTGIAGQCYQLVIKNGTIEWRGFTKQFIGAVVCKLMEANGFEKTGKKKSVPHSEFTKGEFYRAVN